MEQNFLVKNTYMKQIKKGDKITKEHHKYKTHKRRGIKNTSIKQIKKGIKLPRKTTNIKQIKGEG